MELPETLRKPIADIDAGKAWIVGLNNAGLLFHFEDEPATIVTYVDGERTFSDADAEIVQARVDELYWFDWGDDECPIGFALSLPGVAENA